MAGLDSFLYKLGLKPRPEVSLYKAILLGDLEKVKSILESKPDKNITHGVFWVGELNRYILASPKQNRLISQGKQVYWKGIGQPGRLVSPAQFAFDRNQFHKVFQEMVNILVAYGFPRPGVQLYKELTKAILDGDTTTIESLIKVGVDPNLSYGNDKPIIIATEKGNNSVVRLLVEGGATINVFSEWSIREVFNTEWMYSDNGSMKKIKSGRETPLMIALKNTNWELAAYFLDKGADVHGEDINNETALIKAQRHHAPDTLIQRLQV